MLKDTLLKKWFVLRPMPDARAYARALLIVRASTHTVTRNDRARPVLARIHMPLRMRPQAQTYLHTQSVHSMTVRALSSQTCLAGAYCTLSLRTWHL